MSETTPSPGPGGGKPEDDKRPAAAAGATPGGAPPKLPAGDKKPADFRVIRSAPPPDPGATNMVPLVLAFVVVVGLAVGGYLYTQRSSAGGDGKTGPGKTGPVTTTGTGTEFAAAAPDFVMEKISFYENEGRLDDALTHALEQQKEYPDAPNLKAKIKELREKTGVVELPPDEAIAAAGRRIQAKQYEEALAALDAIDADGLTDAQKGKLYFTRAAACIGLGNGADASSALDSAANFGYPAAEVDALRQQLPQ